MLATQSVLTARGLVKAFRGTRAVDGIDLTVAFGERLGLLGPNGAGKTTTLLMLLGAIRPDEGVVEIAGHRLPRRRSQAMEHVGFAAGYLPMPDRLKVREALGIFAGLYGVDDERAAVANALERFGVTHLADRPCQELSSGQRTLVGIVKAVLHHPQLLVLDEPTASLDPDIARRVRTSLLEVCAETGCALLITSHDMREVERLCERVVFLSRGRIVADDNPSAVVERFGHDDLEGVFVDLATGVLETVEDQLWNMHRVATVIRRHAYVLRRSPHRFFDVTFWPFMDVLVFGSLGAFVSQENAATKAGTPYLLAGIMLFHVLFQVQIGVATGFLEETWSRNLLNVMTTPVTEGEYALGIGVFGLAKLVMALVTLSITGLVFYGFHLDRVGIALIPAVAVLLVFGWAISLVVIGLVLRFGPSAEILTWGLNYVALALSGVFNPVEALPGVLQPIARLFPSTHAFAAVRNALDGHPLDWGNVGLGLFGALVSAALGLWFVTTMLKVFRRRGFVTRFS